MEDNGLKLFKSDLDDVKNKVLFVHFREASARASIVFDIACFPSILWIALLRATQISFRLRLAVSLINFALAWGPMRSKRNWSNASAAARVC